MGDDPIPTRQTAVPKDLTIDEYRDMIFNRDKYKLSGYDINFIMAQLCGLGDPNACDAFYDWYGIHMKKEVEDARKQLDQNPDDIPSQVMWEELTGTIDSIKHDAPEGITNADRWYMSTKDPRVKTFFVGGKEVPIPSTGQQAPPEQPQQPVEAPPMPEKPTPPPSTEAPPAAPSRLSTLKSSIKTSVDLINTEDQALSILRCINESV